MFPENLAITEDQLKCVFKIRSVADKARVLGVCLGNCIDTKFFGQVRNIEVQHGRSGGSEQHVIAALGKEEG